MKRLLALCIVTVATAALLTGCGGGKEPSEETIGVVGTQTLALQVDDYTITQKFLQDYIDRLPDDQKVKYNTDLGRAELADRFIEEELYYREAVDENLESDEQVRKELENAKRRILINAYYRTYVQAEAKPSEKDMHDYYDMNRDEFTLQESRRASQIFMKDLASLEEVKERILEGGESFSKMAFRYSEDDLTQRDGGDMGWFSPGGWIRGVGFEEAVSESLFSWERGRVYGPIKWSKGYSLFAISEIQQPELQPFEDVRPQIENALIAERIEEARASVVERVSPNYETHNYMREKYLQMHRDPKELFALAQQASKARDKINIYREVVAKFPDDELAPKAQFMVGFVFAEEVADYASARREFEKVVLNYPDTDVADQARWMMENLGAELPEFEDLEGVGDKAD